MKNLLFIITLFISATEIKAQSNDPWFVYMTPNEVHDLLKKMSGRFTMEIIMTMEQGKEVNPVTLTSEHTMILGGRFLEMKQQGNMFGMDYESNMTIGFNTIDKKMSITTMTNMGTGTLNSVGFWNEKSKSASLTGHLVNPVTQNIINIRQVITFVDEDALIIENFDQEGDKPEIKTMQYKFTRNK